MKEIRSKIFSQLVHAREKFFTEVFYSSEIKTALSEEYRPIVTIRNHSEVEISHQIYRVRALMLSQIYFFLYLSYNE